MLQRQRLNAVYRYPPYLTYCDESVRPAEVLQHFRKTMVYVAKNTGGQSFATLGAMTSHELTAWAEAASAILKMEHGKEADDNYSNKPDEYWDDAWKL